MLKKIDVSKEIHFVYNIPLLIKDTAWNAIMIIMKWEESAIQSHQPVFQIASQ